MLVTGLCVYGRFEILRNTHLVIFLGAELDERRVHLLIDGATHDEGIRRR